MTNTRGQTRPTTNATKRRLVACATALLSACWLAAPAAVSGQTGRHTHAPAAHAQQGGTAAAGPGGEVELNGVKVALPDLILLDQEGRKVRLYSDLIKGKVVVLTFFYTSCAFVCTMQGTTFSKLQTLLGERLGKSVFLVSVTTDPATDTPQQLKAWAARYHVKPGWTLVTGGEAELNKLLPQFTGNPAGRGMHGAMTFIGNDRNGVWMSTRGVLAPEELFNAAVAMTQDNEDAAK
jgi:protein SCO1/2